MPRLTDAAIRRITPGERDIDVRDEGADGLYLRVRPSGSRSWRFGYSRHGAVRWFTIGRYPGVGLGDARKEARRLRAMVDADRDPQAERAAKRQREAGAWTVEAIFGAEGDAGWYLSTYVKTAGRGGGAKTERSIRTDRGYLDKHVRSRREFMRKPVSEVTRADIERIKAKASPGAWRKVRAILRIGFRHCETIDQRPKHSNPVDGVKATPDRKVKRYLKAEERQRLAEVLDECDGIGPSRRGHPGGVSRSVTDAIRLLALTGMRLGEVASLDWEWIDLDEQEIRLPTSKTGAKEVPLTAQAVEFLRELKSRSDGLGPVFSGRTGGRAHATSIQRAWRNIIRDHAGLGDVRLHDLRHSWASDAISAGVPLATVAVVLGQSQLATTQRYGHLHKEALRRGLEATGARIEAATRHGKLER